MLGKTARILMAVATLSLLLPSAASVSTQDAVDEADSECKNVSSRSGTGLTWWIDDTAHNGCDEVVNATANPVEYVQNETPTPEMPTGGGGGEQICVLAFGLNACTP